MDFSQILSIVCLGLAVLIAGRSLIMRRSAKSNSSRFFVYLAIFLLFTSFSMSEKAIEDFLVSNQIPISHAAIAKIFGIMWWLGLGVVVMRGLSTFVWKGILSHEGRMLVPQVFVFMIDLVILIIMISLCAMVVFQVDFKTISSAVTSGGVIALAFSFMGRTLIENGNAGLVVNLSNPFKIGNRVQISDMKAPIEGVVDDIGFAYVIIRQDNGCNLYIPNIELLRRTIVNLERPTPDVRYDLEVVFDFKVTIVRAKEIISAALGEVDDQIPKYAITVKNFTATGVTFLIQFWIGKHIKVPDAYDLVQTALYYKIQHEMSVDLGFDKNAAIHTAHAKGVDIPLEKKIALIRDVSTFASLSDEKIKALAEISTPRMFGPPEKILKQGDDVDSIFVNAKGQVQVYVTTPDVGGRIVLSVDGPGKVFGELGVFTGQKRMATVTALTDVLLLEIPKEHIQALIGEDQALANKIAERLVQIQTENDAKIAAAQKQAFDMQAHAKSLEAKFKTQVLRFLGIDPDQLRHSHNSHKKVP
jgi:CRP-like cAMP-binding protein/small-conductance mechanosensitive channel